MIRSGFLVRRVKEEKDYYLLEINTLVWWSFMLPWLALFFYFLYLYDRSNNGGYFLIILVLSIIGLYGVWPFIVPYYRSAFNFRPPRTQGSLLSRTNPVILFFPKTPKGFTQTTDQKIPKRKPLYSVLIFMFFMWVITGFALKIPMLNYIQNLTVPKDSLGIMWLVSFFIAILIIVIFRKRS